MVQGNFLDAAHAPQVLDHHCLRFEPSPANQLLCKLLKLSRDRELAWPALPFKHDGADAGAPYMDWLFQSPTWRAAACDPGYGTFRLNFHRFDCFELDLRGHTQP